jgi:hypothetical protein
MAGKPNDKKPNDAKPQEDTTELTERDLGSVGSGMLDGVRGEQTNIKHKSPSEFRPAGDWPLLRRPLTFELSEAKPRKLRKTSNPS